ncbi:hypothetical protein K8I61_08100 [bacterium]|nr:hypothetical protein [bacterium]
MTVPYFPGTRLYTAMKNAGRVLHDDFWKYTSYRTVFQPAHFTPEHLDELFVNFYKRVFSRRNIARRFFHMLSIRHPWGSFMTQLSMAVNSLLVRRNVMRGVLPYY